MHGTASPGRSAPAPRPVRVTGLTGGRGLQSTASPTGCDPGDGVLTVRCESANNQTLLVLKRGYESDPARFALWEWPGKELLLQDLPVQIVLVDREVGRARIET